MRQSALALAREGTWPSSPSPSALWPAPTPTPFRRALTREHLVGYQTAPAVSNSSIR